MRMSGTPPAPESKFDGPKRQHYLPRAYLRGFEREGGVAVFDRETGDIRRQPIEGTGAVGHLYTFEDREGRRRFDLEHLFSQIESGFSQAVSKFEAWEGIDGKDIEYLLLFIAFAELRTPGALEDARGVKAGFIRTLGHAATGTPERAYASLRRMYRDKGESISEADLRRRADEVARFVQDGRYDVVVDEKAALMESIKLWEPLVKALWEKNLLIARAEGDAHYITCDSPVVLDSLRGKDVGFGSPDALILFPLTSRLLVSMSGDQKRGGRATASRKQVQNANEVLAQNAFRYVIGPDEAELKRLADSLGLAGTKRGPRYETGVIELGDSTLGFVKRVLPHRRREPD